MKVELIDNLGDDNRVVDAARVSFDKIASNYSDNQNDRLIRYLAEHNHWTPFSHCMITLRETVPIFVARQRFKHTVGFTYNEVSRRYVDSEPEFYTPDKWRKKADNKKQGSSDEPVDDEATVSEIYRAAMYGAYTDYKMMLDFGVAPELARSVLPQSTYTSYYTTGSLAAFARAYKLRSSEDSQKEIQILAQQWNDVISPLYPISWEALTQ